MIVEACDYFVVCLYAIKYMLLDGCHNNHRQVRPSVIRKYIMHKTQDHGPTYIYTDIIHGIHLKFEWLRVIRKHKRLENLLWRI